MFDVPVRKGLDSYLGRIPTGLALGELPKAQPSNVSCPALNNPLPEEDLHPVLVRRTKTVLKKASRRAFSLALPCSSLARPLLKPW
jgi:hypothetical protein